MIKPKVVLLIFVSGKIVLTGAKVSTPVSFIIQKTSPCCTFLTTSALGLMMLLKARRCLWGLICPRLDQVDSVRIHPLTMHFLSTSRSGKRFTPRSTPFTPCCASSVNLDVVLFIVSSHYSSAGLVAPPSLSHHSWTQMSSGTARGWNTRRTYIKKHVRKSLDCSARPLFRFFDSFSPC